MGETQLVIMEGARVDYPNALVDSLITKTSVTQGVKDSGKAEPLGKCVNPATGEPVSARREDTALKPLAGSVVPSEDGNGKGSCPVCSTLVKLSGKGFVTAHTVRRERIPAPKARLVERQAEVTDSGARVGSPDASERDRTAELSGATGTGTVRVQVQVKDECVQASVTDQVTGKRVFVPVEGVTLEMVNQDGKRETIEVPATVQNIRTAIRQESRKKLRPEHKKSDTPGVKGEPTGRMLGGPDTKLLARLNRMLKGATGLETVGVLGAEPGCYNVREAVTLDAVHAPQGGREEGMQGDRTAHVPSSPGTALVQGRSERPVVGATLLRHAGEPYVRPADAVVPEGERVTSKGKPRNAVGWSQPVGRTRPDRVVLAGGDAGACNAAKGKPCTVKGCVAVVGGRDGYMECHAFRLLRKTQKRDYWAVVAKKRRNGAAGRKRAKGPKMAGGYGHVSGEPVKAGVRRVTA